MEALLAFAASLLAFRFAGDLLRRHRERRSPHLAAWGASLLAYALASAALAWGSAAGWSEAAFRAYYLFGGLLTAPLLGVGSLLLVSRRRTAIAAIALVYVGLAAGVAVAEPLTQPLGGASIPEAQAHLDHFPARILAIAANGLGTVAVVAVALATLRARPLANALVVAGTLVAAAGSGLAGLGIAETAAFVAAAAALLYAGFVTGERGRRTRPVERAPAPT